MSESLGKIAKGGAIAFIGMLFFNFSEFINRMIIARYATPGEYGTFSIGVALLYLLILVSCLGLQASVTRCMPFFKAKEQSEKVSGIIYSSLQISIAASLFIGALLFSFANILADIFHIEQFNILRSFAIALPFFVIVEMLSAIFTGFGRMNERVYFRDILLSSLKVLGIILAIILGFGFSGMVVAYTLSAIISAIFFSVYTVKKLSSINFKKRLVNRKKLIYFSLPVLIGFLSNVVNTRMDTLMLGYFKTSDIVGLYNTASPIAQLIPIFLGSMSLIYVPISSQLYSKNLIGELRRNYAVLTKWVISETLPFFLIIFLFPEAVISIIFGPSYVQASNALRILALGGLIQVVVGPAAVTLVVTGNTKLNMLDDLFGIIMDILLNFFLIPTMGIIGAAIASSVSFAIVSLLKSVQILWLYKMNSFTLNFIKPLITSTLIISIIYVIFMRFFYTHITIWILILFFLLILVTYFTCFIITRSIDKEDIIMLQEIGKLLNIKSNNYYIIKISSCFRKFANKYM